MSQSNYRIYHRVKKTRAEGCRALTMNRIPPGSGDVHSNGIKLCKTLKKKTKKKKSIG